MIIREGNYSIVSRNSNNVYWEEGLYPDWAAINTFRDYPHEPPGRGVEPHYHDGDEFWLFTSGRGEVWLDGKSFEITPNTAVYTPMGVVHRLQMFTGFDNVALVTRLERHKRAEHILVEEEGPPVPTVPGFVVPRASNNGPIGDRGERCPLSELRLITFGAGERVNEERLSHNEHWLVVGGAVHLAVDGSLEIELVQGDVALLRAGAVREIRANGGARVVLARE